MASSKVMATSRSSDLKRKLSSCSSSSAADFLRGNAPETNLAHSDSLPVNEFLRNPYVDTSSSQVRPDESSSGKLLNEEITLFDVVGGGGEKTEQPRGIRKTVDDVWREIVAGKKSKSSEPQQRQQQQQPKEEMMTLEDFLVKAAAVEAEEEEEESKKGVVVKIKKERSTGSFFGYEDKSSAIGRVGSLDVEGSLGMGMGRGKRSMSLLEPLDKAAQQRQRRMIKNRESAARSRERKQAYQVELESMAVRLEEENEQLLREKAERTKKRLKQLMENVIPVVEKRRPPRLRRLRSM